MKIIQAVSHAGGASGFFPAQRAGMTKREMLVLKAGQFPSLMSWLARGASQAGLAIATFGAAAGLAALLAPTLFGALKTRPGFYVVVLRRLVRIARRGRGLDRAHR